MMRRLVLVSLVVTLCLTVSTGSMATVEWVVQNTLDLGETPVDVAVSADGVRIFVLTEEGNILIYSAYGKLEEEIATGEPADGISVSPRGDRLFLQHRQNKKVRVLSLNYIQQIDEQGSPVKGPPGARVSMVVFSDFQ